MTESEMREEIRRTNVRAMDYIHEAQLACDAAVATFQSLLAQRMRPWLIELEDGTLGLTAEQRFFRLRLEEIRNTLRDLGVNL